MPHEDESALSRQQPHGDLSIGQSSVYMVFPHQCPSRVQHTFLVGGGGGGEQIAVNV